MSEITPLFRPFEIPVLSYVPLVIRSFKESDTLKFKSLIKEGVDVNEVDENGYTALHYATCGGQNEMMQELLLAGADRTIVCGGGRLTALFLAIRNQHKSCISSLLCEKFLVGIKDDSSEEKRDYLRFVVNQPSRRDRIVPLSAACVYFPSSVDVLLELLKAGAQVKDCYDSVGFLPIHYASLCCSKEVVELLLERGANPESLTSGNMPCQSPLRRIGSSVTPLACASLALNKEAFDALVQAGADPNTCISQCNIHPLQMVCQNLHHELREELFWLHIVRTEEEAIEMLSFVLEFPDGKIDYQNKEADTALHFASKASCREAVELLLNAGANPNIKNSNGRTPAETTADPTIKALLEAYRGGNSAHVDEGRSNLSLTQSDVQAVGFTKKKQSLVSSKGDCIGVGSGNADTAIIGQPKANDSKDQSSGIFLTIPENALSEETVALTVNYTSNPPVLILRQDVEKGRFLSPPTKSEKDIPEKQPLVESEESLAKGQCDSKIVQFSLPVIDLSKEAKETVISPFVTITANRPVVLSKQGHVTFPHCAESTQDLSQAKNHRRQFAITIKEQSLTEDGHITDWRAIHGNKVKCTDDEASVLIDKIEPASTYVAIAECTTGKPVREVMKKRMQFWILGNPKLEQQMHVAAVFCTNAYRPAKLVAQLQEDSSLKLQPWHPVPYPVITQKDIKVAMSTSEEGWEFDPVSQLVENDALVSPGAIFPYVFCLDSGKGKLQKIRCNCSLEYDEGERKLAFYTPDKAGRKEEERLSAGEEGKIESDCAVAVASAAIAAQGEQASALCTTCVESEKNSILDLDKSLFDVEEAIQVVAKFCSNDWLRFGLALGYNDSEMKSFAYQADNPEGKLELVIRCWMDDKGEKATVGALLDLCDRIRKRGRVEQELKKSCA